MRQLPSPAPIPASGRRQQKVVILGLGQELKGFAPKPSARQPTPQNRVRQLQPHQHPRDLTQPQ